MAGIGSILVFTAVAALVFSVIMGGMTLLYFGEKNKTSVRRPAPPEAVRSLEPLGSALEGGAHLHDAPEEQRRAG